MSGQHDIIYSQSLDFLEKIVDLMEGQKESIGELAKQIFHGLRPQIIIIGNTCGDRVTNDLLINELNKLDNELNDRFPFPEDIKAYIQNVKGLIRWAAGRHFQNNQEKLDDALINALKMVGMKKMPLQAYYNPKKAKEEVVEFED